MIDEIQSDNMIKDIAYYYRKGFDQGSHIVFECLSEMSFFSRLILCLYIAFEPKKIMKKFKEDLILKDMEE